MSNPSIINALHSDVGICASYFFSTSSHPNCKIFPDSVCSGPAFSVAEQASRALGPPQLPPPIDLPVLLHLRAMVQRPVRAHRREGQYYVTTLRLGLRFGSCAVSGATGAPFSKYSSQVHSDPEWRRHARLE